MHTKKQILTIVVLVSLLLISSCRVYKQNSSQDNTNEAMVIRINDTERYGSHIIGIVRAKDLLDLYLPDNIIVEWTSVTNSTNIRDAIATGDIDIASLGIPNYILAKESNYPILLLARSSTTSSYFYSNNEKIMKFEDINSTTRVAIASKGTINHLAFLIKCEEVFGDPMIYDNNLVAMSYSDMITSLSTSNEIDCAIITMPAFIEADQIPTLVRVEDMTQIYLDNHLDVCFVVSNDFYQSNPELVDAFMKAVEDAFTYVDEYPNEAAELLSEAYKIDASYVKDELRKLPHKTDIMGYDELASFLYHVGMLDKEPGLFIDLPNLKEVPHSN